MWDWPAMVQIHIFWHFSFIEVYVNIPSYSSIKVWLKLTSWIPKRRSSSLLISHMILKRPKHRSHVKNEKSFFSDFRFVVPKTLWRRSHNIELQMAEAFACIKFLLMNEIKLEIQNRIYGHGKSKILRCGKSEIVVVVCYSYINYSANLIILPLIVTICRKEKSWKFILHVIFI